ncbi:MAG: zinc-ribbon domain-containing protein [Tepidisphaeraceae bacterium]
MKRARRGFILLFGTKAIVSDDPEARPISAVCPQCGQRTDILAKRYRTWFTLFFLPLFPVSRSRAFSQCGNCGAQFSVETRTLGSHVAASEQQQSQRAIALYNSLRNSPANSITLNDLMGLYASMQEFDPAISASREFPAALENSEQCMVTLGRVYLAKEDRAEAIRWFDRAIERNDALGEAHYFKGVALLTASPPDFSAAAASARRARVHGHPGADELLREAESNARGQG